MSRRTDGWPPVHAPSRPRRPAGAALAAASSLWSLPLLLCLPLLPGCGGAPATRAGDGKAATHAAPAAQSGAAASPAAGTVAAAAQERARRDALEAAGTQPLARGEARRYLQQLALRLRSATLQTPISVIVDEEHDAVRVRLPAPLLFAPDAIQLREAALPEIDVIATALAEFERSLVDVNGYSDALGTRAANEAFTGQRAAAVAARLLGQGIEPRRVQARGLGEAEPLGPETDAPTRQRDRRVELVIRPLLR
ncbi:MAG: OmpA family protein [Steroidobacteraceae bacterium]